jgi:adenine phosphoribosyltransferase
MSDRLIQTIQNAPILKKGSYPYLIHPLFDGFPSINPSLLEEVAIEMEQLITPYLPVDRIITVEAMGIPLATLVSQHLKVPFTIIRKRHYPLSDEICVTQETGYAKTQLYLNGINQDDTIIFIDDIISTGGTFQAIYHALRERNIIKAGFFIINKGTMMQQISRDTQVPLHSLVHISIKDNQIHIHD